MQKPTIIQKMRLAAGKLAIGAGAALSASSAFAIDDSVLNTAISGGQTSYGLVVAGVIALAATGFGITLILGLLKR